MCSKFAPRCQNGTWNELNTGKYPGNTHLSDLAGVQFLLAARKHASDAGTDLVVRHPHRSVSRVLELTGSLPLVCPDTAGAAARTQAPDAAVISACETALGEAIGVSGADTGNAQLVVPASGALRIVAQHGFKRPFLDFFETVHDEESACGTALAAGEPAWVPQVARSPIFAGTPARDVMLEAGSRAVASVPVQAGDGNVIAMISVHYHEPAAHHRFGPGEPFTSGSWPGGPRRE